MPFDSLRYIPLSQIFLSSCHISSPPPHRSSHCHKSPLAPRAPPERHCSVNLTVRNWLWLPALHLTTAPRFVSPSQVVLGSLPLDSKPSKHSYYCHNLPFTPRTPPHDHPNINLTVTNRLGLFASHLKTTSRFIALLKNRIGMVTLHLTITLPFVHVNVTNHLGLLVRYLITIPLFTWSSRIAFRLSCVTSTPPQRFSDSQKSYWAPYFLHDNHPIVHPTVTNRLEIVALHLITIQTLMSLSWILLGSLHFTSRTSNRLSYCR